jgi:hypothetical protein
MHLGDEQLRPIGRDRLGQFFHAYGQPVLPADERIGLETLLGLGVLLQ